MARIQELTQETAKLWDLVDEGAATAAEREAQQAMLQQIARYMEEMRRLAGLLPK